MEAHDIHQWDDIYPDRETIRKDIQNQELYVVDDDGAIAGIMTLNEAQAIQYRQVKWNYNEKVLIIHRVAVDPAFQRKGFAKALLGFAENYAHEKGYQSLRLDAFLHNPAPVHLYEKVGYQKVGIVNFRKGPFFCLEKLLN